MLFSLYQPHLLKNGLPLLQLLGPGPGLQVSEAASTQVDGYFHLGGGSSRFDGFTQL